MSDKSYVTMEQHICPVCGKTFDTGNIIMDKRLKESFDSKTVTGYGLCEEHEELFNQGYVALIEIDEKKSNLAGKNKDIHSKDVYRTGNLAHIKIDIFRNIFSFSPPHRNQAYVFVEEGLIEKLKLLIEEDKQKIAEEGEILK